MQSTGGLDLYVHIYKSSTWLMQIRYQRGSDVYSIRVFTQSNKHPHHTFTVGTRPEDNNNNSANK